MLDDKDISLESLVIHKQSILDAAGVEKLLIEIDEEIKKLSNAIKSSKTNTEEQIKKQNLLMASIFKEMNSAYKNIDQTGSLVFEELFTKRGEVISGSEATEFHLLKLYALAKILKHPCPIVVDSFCAEDLSTERENAIITLFTGLGKQVIFTTTLKNEELGKYQEMSEINNIDYSKNLPSKILRSELVEEFAGLLKQLSINI